MSQPDGTITIDTEISTDGMNPGTKDIEKSLKRVSNTVKDLGESVKNMSAKLVTAGSKMTGIGTTLTVGITAPVLAAGKSMVQAASDFEENLNKVDVAFGNSAKSVTEWAENATEQFGLSKNQALETTALFGDMATSMGLTQPAAADMSTSLAGLAGDLASFKNIDIEQAMTALSGVFTGETESLKQLGIVMTETNLEEFAERTGKVYSEMGQAEKVQLRYNYVMEMTKNAQGDYARTADGTANSLRTFQGAIDNLSIAFGQHLLPIITPVITKMTDLVKKFSETDAETQKLILGISGIAAAMGPALAIIGKMVSSIGTLVNAFGPVLSKISALGGIKTALSGVFTALSGPIGIAIAAVSALVAVFAYLMSTNEEFRESVMSVISTILNAVKPIISSLIPIIMQVGGIIKETVNSILQASAPVLAQIITLLGNVFALIMQIVSWIVENILPVIVPIIEQIAAVVSGVFSTISNVLSGIITALGGIIDFIVGIFTGDWERAWNGIKEFFSGIWNAISSFFTGVWDVLVSIVKTAINIIKSVITTVWNAIKSVTSTIWNFISGLLTGIWNGLKDAVSSAFNFIKSIITGVWNGIKSATSAVWNGILGVIKGVINGIIGGINGMIRGVVSGINAIIKVLNKLNFKIPDWVPGLGGKKFGFNIKTITAPQIPYLASGAVIPPNQEFLAVLGDQKQGTNIEAPESLIRKIMREELAKQKTGGGSYAFTAQINRRTLFEEFIKEAQLQQMRTGRNPFELA